ncbi:MAG: orotate phosphoribosyltransferase [Candidatus Aenigmarchaeota archaeon]|nr:orotate phosphoribosyltransferase [Candidatus Aenigmarchaeota archaeon]
MSGEDVARVLLEMKAVSLNTSKPFRYTSGMLSPIYCDNRLLLSNPEKRELVVDRFIESVTKNKISFDVVAGVATAGIPHAAFISQKLSKPMIYVRAEKKGHGKHNAIEGGLERGQKVLVIEDHISTGGSSVAAVNAIKEAGGKVDFCLAITTYELDSAKKAFEEATCKALTLTDLSTIISVAEKMGYLTKEDGRKIIQWKKDPQGWGKSMGFE